MPLPDDLTQSNPERYHRLSRPFESQEKMEEAFAGFFRELGELREKYKIPDVLMAVSANYLVTGENEPEKNVIAKGMTSMQYGNMQLRPTFVLYLYRQEGEMLQALIEGLST